MESHSQDSIQVQQQKQQQQQQQEPQRIQIYPTSKTGVSHFWREKYERDAKKYWGIFYKKHQDKFFKDRHYLDKEWGAYLEGLDLKVFLEVGCGAGNAVYPLLSTYPDIFIHACDFSRRAVDLVKSHKDFREDRVNAFVCDVTMDDLSKEVSPHSVDIVTMIFVLSAVAPEKMSLVLQNIRKVLKPDGLVLLRDYAIGDLAQSIPKAFERDYLVGEKHRGKAQLKTDRGETVKSWSVSIKGGCFTDGWKEFATQNDLCVGDILVFKHEGSLIFHVLVFDSTACERKYSTLKTDIANQSEAKETIAVEDLSSGMAAPVLKQVANPPTFTVTMRPYNFSWKGLCIPTQFGKENGLAVAKKVRRITLRDPKGKSWVANLRWSRSKKIAYIGGGWSAFSDANMLKVGDDCIFKLVSRGFYEFVMEVSVRRSKTASSA